MSLALGNLDMRAIPVQRTSLASQRRTARLLPTAAVTVRIPGLRVAVEIRDLSFGGFALVASRRFWKGMTHQFAFAGATGYEVTLVAKAVHCYSLAAEGEQKFVSGWEFMAGSAERTEAAIGQLLNIAIER